MALLNVFFTKVLKFAKGNSDQNAAPRQPTREEHISRALGKVETYVVWLQSILIWEKPSHTLWTYLCFNTLFWLIVSLDFRFYFLFFSTTLVALIYEMWVDKVWPEIRVPRPAELGDNEGWTPLHPRVLSAPELSHYLNKVMQFSYNQYLWLQNLRSEQPGTFCALVSTACLVLIWVGRSISGTTLLYLIFMSLLMAPGICIHLLPPVSQNHLLDWQSRIQCLGSSEDNSSDVDDYLPEATGSNMVLLEQAVEPDNSDHDDEDEFNIPPADFLQADDITDSGAPSLTFISGISAMPAPEDLSLDGSDFNFDISQPMTNKALPSASYLKSKNQCSSLEVDKSSSDESISLPESENVGIHFQTRHFKRDSSSEDDAEQMKSRDLAKSMGAPVVPRKSSSSGAVAEAAAAVLSFSSAGALNLASLGASVGQSLISSVISSATPSQQSPLSQEEDENNDSLSDTDDFEMISEEEFANL